MRYLLIALCFLVGCGGGNGASSPSYPTYTISNETPTGRFSIRATAQYAGAIDSVTFDDKEFISATCTGDLLQSASSFVYGEGYNPTEAGSRIDGTGPSSSILQAVSAEGNVLKTTSQMAFYMSPGETSSPAFGDPVKAMNATVLSNHILTKQVTIGHPVSPYVIEYLVNFYVAEDNAAGTFEIVTGYMPSEFNIFWAFDPETESFSRIEATNGEQSHPIIISSLDGYAVGIYCPDLPQKEFPLYGYGLFVPPYIMAGETKWNMVFRVNPAPRGNYSFRTYLIVGELDTVKDAMVKLHKYLKGD